MYLPHYCSTLEEAEACLDQIAQEHGLLQKTRDDYQTFTYENERILMTVFIFPDNWYRNISCFSFSLRSLRRKDFDVEEGLPYQRLVRGHLSRQVWRKVPSYFAEDIRTSIKALEALDPHGRVRGIIHEWRGGYGFARTDSIAKVFVWGGDLPRGLRKEIGAGIELLFTVTDTPRGPRASDIIGIDSDEHTPV